MRTGPKPKPTAIKIALGTRSDRINTAEPKFASIDPKPPEYLGTESRKVWSEVVPKIAKGKILTEVDDITLGVLCDSVARYRRIQVEFDKAPDLTIASYRGGSRAHPLTKMAREEGLFILRLAHEFGLTPSARSRVEMDPSQNVDPLTEFMMS